MHWLDKDYHFSWLIWIIGAFITALLIAAVWLFGFATLPERQEAIYYLLSGLGQALAAVFALVFTITLVFTQLATGYSHRLLRLAFPWAVVTYLVIFVLATLYPFFLLNREFNSLEVRISLTLAVFCIALLVPYFIELPSRLGINTLLTYLAKKVKESYLKGDNYEPEELKAIDNIAMTAFSKLDYDTFYLAVGSLVHVPINNKELTTSGVSQILTRLDTISLQVISNSSATKSIINALQGIVADIIDIREKANEKIHGKLDNEIMMVSSSLCKLGTKATTQNHEDTANSIVLALKKIAIRLLEKNFEDLSSGIVSKISSIGEIALDSKSAEIARSSVTQLIHIGIEASKVNNHVILDKVFTNMNTIENKDKNKEADIVNASSILAYWEHTGETVEQFRRSYETWKEQKRNKTLKWICKSPDSG